VLFEKLNFIITEISHYTVHIPLPAAQVPCDSSQTTSCWPGVRASC